MQMMPVTLDSGYNKKNPRGFLWSRFLSVIFYLSVFLSSLHLDPTGKRAIFVESVANNENNGYAKKVMLFDNGKCRTLLSEGNPDNMIWTMSKPFCSPRPKKRKKKRTPP